MIIMGRILAMPKQFDIIDAGYRFLDINYPLNEVNNGNFMDFAQPSVAIEDFARYLDDQEVTFPTVHDLNKYLAIRKPFKLDWYEYVLPAIVNFIHFVCQRKIKFDRGEDPWK